MTHAALALWKQLGAAMVGHPREPSDIERSVDAPELPSSLATQLISDALFTDE